MLVVPLSATEQFQRGNKQYCAADERHDANTNREASPEAAGRRGVARAFDGLRCMNPAARSIGRRLR